MLRIERILFPTDFSESAEKAYDYALSLAQHYGAKLFVQHVVEPPAVGYAHYAIPDSVSEFYAELREQAETQLREFLKVHARGGPPAEISVQGGAVTDMILAFAETHAIDLIVMGTHGRRGLDRLTLGSVTERVLRRAPCPVLAVRKPAHDFVAPEKGAEAVQLHKILWCVDFSESTARAADYAFSLAQEYDAEITLLHVLEHLPGSMELEVATAEATRRLEELVPPDARNWCTIRFAVRAGQPYLEIIQLALEAQTDLVIVGVRGRNALDMALFGSTTQRVIQLGSCPVLAVRG